MSISFTFTRGCNDGVVAISKAEVITSDISVELDSSIAAGTNTAVSLPTINTSKMQSFFLISDIAATVKTNNTTTPGNTFTLLANVPLQWTLPSGYFSNPVTQNITAGLYITNASTAHLQLRSNLSS